jgi:IS6 family transposase
VITVDQNSAYPPVFDALQRDSTLPETCLLRQCKYMNNVVQQDHWCVKRRVNPGLRFGAFHTVQRAIQGDEVVHRLRKGQIEGMARRDVLAQNRVINQMVGLAAKTEHAQPLLMLASVFATLPAKTPLQHVITAVALNVVRLRAW